MVGHSLETFLDLFIGIEEVAELEERGPEETHRIHTARGLAEYSKMLTAAGFIEQTSWSDDKLFYWVGTSPSDTDS